MRLAGLAGSQLTTDGFDAGAIASEQLTDASTMSTSKLALAVTHNASDETNAVSSAGVNGPQPPFRMW